jgi:hypothetical protein
MIEKDPSLQFDVIPNSPSIKLDRGVDQFMYCKKPKGVKSAGFGILRDPAQVCSLNGKNQLCLGNIQEVDVEKSIASHNIYSEHGDCSMGIFGYGNTTGVCYGLHVGTNRHANYALMFDENVEKFLRMKQNEARDFQRSLEGQSSSATQKKKEGPLSGL